MSASDPNSAIYVTDSEKVIKNKVSIGKSLLPGLNMTIIRKLLDQYMDIPWWTSNAYANVLSVIGGSIKKYFLGKINNFFGSVSICIYLCRCFWQYPCYGYHGLYTNVDMWRWGLIVDADKYLFIMNISTVVNLDKDNTCPNYILCTW